LLLLSGCTLGPKVERQTVFIRTYDANGRPVIVGTVAENKKVKMKYETQDGGSYTEYLDIGGWDVSPPPLPEPKPAPIEGAKP
jgi:hypothetical protein